MTRFFGNKEQKDFTSKVQGISSQSQTVESNLAMREGRTDVSDILRHLFSRKLKRI